jgi:hypothetical protein
MRKYNEQVVRAEGREVSWKVLREVNLLVFQRHP